MAAGANDEGGREKLLLGGLILVGAVAAVGLPKLLTLGRAATSSLGGMTYRSHTPSPSRPTADPARGYPA